MNRRERIENTIAGNTTDYIPALLTRHFPGDDQRPADFSQSIFAFQQTYDWDIVAIRPASTDTAADYGAQSAWKGSPIGDRTMTSNPVTRSLNWTELRTLDPERGATGKQLAVVEQICARLDDPDTPVLLTIYSPLLVAQKLAGKTLFQRNMRTHSDRLRSGLNIITENTLRLIQALKRTPAAGIVYVIKHADYDVLSDAEYLGFGQPYDQKILSELDDKWWMNILSIEGNSPMFQHVQDYPVHAVSWQTTGADPDIPQGKSLIRGAVCGGLGSDLLVQTESPSLIKQVAREAIQQANGRRLILSVNGPLYLTTPLSNLRAVRDVSRAASRGE
jgi:uroporphyrinogen decarboxylase